MRYQPRWQIPAQDIVMLNKSCVDILTLFNLLQDVRLEWET